MLATSLNLVSTTVRRVGHPYARTTRTTRTRALPREWEEEYEDALVQKDLGRALGSLKSLQQPLLRRHDAVRVLDTCLDSRDMDLVCATYDYLKDRGFLLHFAKFKHSVLEGTREVTHSVFKSATGLDGSISLSTLTCLLFLFPSGSDTVIAKWFVSILSCAVTKMIFRNKLPIYGALKLILVAFLGGWFLLSRGIDIRIYLAAILGLAFVDYFLLGGRCWSLVASNWPPIKRRVLVHEAGHLLVAYLMGFVIRGVILDPLATQGLAQTRSWDEDLSKELDEQKVSSKTFDRYCMMVFGGVAAEALVYGEAEGAADDEEVYWRILSLLERPLSLAETYNQARWAVLQAYNLLKRHRDAHTAAVKALEDGESLSSVIMRVDKAISTAG